LSCAFTEDILTKKISLHVVLGGILWKGYNHIMQPISDLTATGAPDRVLLSRITLAYALCSIAFAVCAYIYLRKSVPKVTRAGMITFFANKLPYFGLFERINIGSLRIWMLVFSLTLFLDKGEAK